MVEPAISKQIPLGSNGAIIRIPGPDNQARNPSQTDCSGTHRARLQGHRHGPAIQAPRPAEGCCRAQRQNFRVGGGVSECLTLIMRGNNYLAVLVRNDRPNRDVTMGFSQTRLN